ncbi:MAG: DUF3570 domain-containing protein [Gammaproteobacteria bacterium]|nr:DUF3570 domain-containing protein [Gammaproteobacteria bacterium]
MAARPENIRGALTLATFGLLASAPGQSGAASTEVWDVDSSVLYYSEKDRIDVVEPSFSAKKDRGDDASVTVRGAIDVMTGASPNGATISDTVQTFTGASGNKSYTVAPNTLPTVDFRDARFALGADWETPDSRTERHITGLSGSVESDYLSMSGSYTKLWDTADRLRTWSAGLGGGLDMVSPTGGTPKELQLLSTESSDDDDDDEDRDEDDDGEGGEGGDLLGGETKLTLDAMVGVTQVLSPRSLLQLNYSLSYRDGYLNDPYKVVSLIDAGGATTDYFYESRPGSRLANILYLKWVYHLPEDVFRVSFRYFTDDWGVRSTTVDLSYRLELGRGFFAAPYGRRYSQTAADFYRHSLPDSEAIPSEISADYRLAEMDSTTVGLKLGRADGEDSEWSLVLERMVQTGDSHPADAIGIQNNFDLYPELEALIIQLNYFARF